MVQLLLLKIIWYIFCIKTIKFRKGLFTIIVFTIYTYFKNYFPIYWKNFRINLNVYDRAILLIRNPLDAFIAEFNRDFTRSNTAIVPIEKWLELDVYDIYENQLLRYWKKFHQQILDEYKNELILVEYEALKSNVIGELTKVMKFLGLPMTDAIKECIRNNPDGLYKRPKPKETLKEMLVRNGKLQNGHIKLSNHAYQEMVKLIKTKIRSINSKLKTK